MSRGSRQEVFIRSLVEGLCIALRNILSRQDNAQPKLDAISMIKVTLETLCQNFPVRVTLREEEKVIAALMEIKRQMDGDQGLQNAEVLIAMTLGLSDKLVKVLKKSPKFMLVNMLNQQIQGLYNTFDQQGSNVGLIIRGGEFADQILRREI